MPLQPRKLRSKSMDTEDVLSPMPAPRILAPKSPGAGKDLSLYSHFAYSPVSPTLRSVSLSLFGVKDNDLLLIILSLLRIRYATTPAHPVGQPASE